jgi:acyl carrier protein
MQLAGDVMTHAEALDWIAEMFEEPKGRIRSDTPRRDIPAWDSLGQLILMSALDQQFGIRLGQSELGGLASVQDILDILARHEQLQDI